MRGLSLAVWFITGASRGMGVEVAQAALERGHSVVATGRDPGAVTEAIGPAEQLLAARLDVTRADQAEEAVAAAVERFGRVDVLVNNAGLSYKGFFEEMSPADLDHQLAVNLIGPMNVTRAVLPQMRRQRAGHLIAISSGAGLIGFAFSSIYAAAKAGLEGWMSALHDEVVPFGIHTTVVNPGFFRTDLISERSMSYAHPSIADYDGLREAQQQWWRSQAGKQPGDPVKLAAALVGLAERDPPPRRFLAGADAIDLAERKARMLLDEVEADRELSTSLAHDDSAQV
jgi:NAD(P)-dependent dehydrogenase (short-subunit alcohol dehydrogenase family)